MHSAHDLLTRWPALDVAAKRARLQDTFQLSPGPLRDVGAASAEAAERAAAGLWRRDPSVWSSDAAVQRTIANRLGWLSSPALMADSIPRLRGVRVVRFAGTGSPTSCCSAWAARVSRRKCCARCSASRQAGRAFTCSTRPIRPPFARSPPSRPDALHPAEQVGHDDRAEFARRAFQGTRSKSACRAGTTTSSRSPTKAPSWRSAPSASVSRRLHQSVRHRRPLFGAVRSSASCRRR